MKIMIFGATGMLGQALVECFKKKHELILVERADCDLFVTENIFTYIIKMNPLIVINAAALVDINSCEVNKEYAFRVNSIAVSRMALACNQIGAKLVQVSTDHYYINDSDKKHTEENLVSIVNYYAYTKFVAEAYALLSLKHLIIRTNIVGFNRNTNKKNFIEWAVDGITNEKRLTLFNDYFISSIDIYQFCEIIKNMISFDLLGLYNVGCKEVISKACFVQILAEKLNKNLNLPCYVSVYENYNLVKRANSLGLDVSKIEGALGCSMPSVYEVVNKLVEVYNNVQKNRERN